MKKYFCDRCNKEIVPYTDFQKECKFIIEIIDRITGEVDLCINCYGEVHSLIRTWISNWTG